MQPKRIWKQVDGVLLLDKPVGMSSNDALQKARRLFSAAKAGHTGTLDPLASGLLPLCFGEATKFSADLLDADKAYVATLQLGITTDSGDAEGQVLARHPVTVGKADLLALLPRFSGVLDQIPPMYSALKRGGRPLYELARKGVTVEREPRRIVIRSLELLAFEQDTAVLRVACSKGTYIRVLAEDIGAALGCGAHLAALRRTGVGDLDLGAAVTLEALEALDDTARQTRLAPVDTLLQTFPAVSLDEAAAQRFGHGNSVLPPAGVQGLCRTYAGARLLGVGEVRTDGKLWPKRLVQLAQ